jgi:antitoxin ParD1/3/4
MGEMSFPPDLQAWIEARVAEGRFADMQDYLRDLVRRDQEGILPESPEEVAWIREQVAIGLASGICEKDAFEVLDEIRASREARRG